MFMMMLRMKARFAGWAAMLAIILVMPLTVPTPARAAGTTNWRCNVRADQPQTLALSSADLARPNADRRVYDLDCTFTATAPGPSPVTLCVSAPEGENAGGPLRRLKRRGGNEMIAYRLTAQTGNVPGAVSYPIGELRPTPQALYTAQAGGGEAGTDGTFRHQLALITEFQGIGKTLIAAGEYADTVTDLVISIHEGADCGLLLWGPPSDSLGTAANLVTALAVPNECSVDDGFTIIDDFGVIAETPTINSRTATISIVTSCNTGFSGGFSVSNGNNVLGGVNRMKRVGGAPAFIPYTSTTSQVNIVSPPGSPFNRSRFTFVAKIAAGTPTPPAGQYQDTRIATFSY